jgi:hypothetical protein
VLLTAGTIIGVIEINEPELPDSTTKDALMDITGVGCVIVMDRQFAKLNQELPIHIT